MASHNFPVAVVGMAVKLPGAENCDEFWNLMINREDTVGTFPDERARDIQHVLRTFNGQFADEDNPFFTGSFFKSVDEFDADFFNIKPTEALVIEPEQRMFLETVWELLEDAGYASKIRNSNTGVYVGNTVNKYKYVLTENHPSISHGNHSPFISSRVSYTLNLSGPAMMVATGCSSSLLAVHLACQGLLSGDCKMAIAGGITLDLLPLSLKTDIWNQLGITAPNMKCRAFDADAKGIAKAEGCGVVLLKPLESAIADNDHIYGVLEATTANQDGHSQGITAPHPGAQTNMLLQAWQLADITPNDLDYIEAHGTGTELGDPIEIMGITKAFEKVLGKQTGGLRKIPIGSVKANIGHLADGAAGVVSLIKVLLCLKHEKIPPSINYSKPNPHINWDNAPVSVNTEMKNWNESSDEKVRYGSVSAFGLLGTNINAVVRDFPMKKQNLTAVTGDPQLLCLAAKTENSLLNFAGKMSRYFRERPAMSHDDLSSVCFTINRGRESKKFKCRAVAVGESAESMALALEKISTTSARSTTAEPNPYQQEVMNDFVQGKAIDWDFYYKNSTTAQKRIVELLPTYAFERVRYWPDTTTGLNTEYLLLEHHITPSVDANGARHSPTKSTDDINVTTAQHAGDLSLDVILSDALNNALGSHFDWTEHGDTDLFHLGVDSLVSTHVTMQLGQVLGQEPDSLLTQGEFHANPSFKKLQHYLESKLSSLETRENEKEAVLPPKEKIAAKILDASPLSYSQRRLWVMEKMEKTGCTYNATNCFEIKGNLQLDAFVEATNTALSRHDAFLATVKEKDSEPILVHKWEMNNALVEIDLRMYGESAAEKAMELYKLDYMKEFDLSEGPLVRVRLYKISQDKHIFTMVVHHIIFDGWSHFVFYNELWGTYRRCLQGMTLDKTIHVPLSSTFAAKEATEAERTNSKVQQDIEYWMKKLASPLPVCTLPGDKKRPQIFTYEGGRITRFIDLDMIKKLQQSVDGSHTLFHSLLASVFVVLQYFNPSENDFLVGIPVTGRTTFDMKNIIGCFINTLVVRIMMNDKMTFAEILESVANTCLEAQKHQHAPFDHLVSKLKLPRNTSITPVFSVNVCYHNEELRDSHVSPPEDLAINRRLLHNETSKWDMQFDFLEEGDTMRFTLEYYKGAFSDEYALYVVDTFLSLVNTLTLHPSSSIADSITGTKLTELSVLQGPSKDLGQESLADILLRNMESRPKSKIKDVSGLEYEYKMLVTDSQKLAHFFFRVCKLKRGDRVGLLFENSYEGLCVILACLISGLVYVPLSRENPRKRLEIIVNEAFIQMICFSVSNLALANHLHWSCPSVQNLFCIDQVDVAEVSETQMNPLMDTELWNCVASDATNAIEGGGWKSSYTGEFMSEGEMKDYMNNVLTKLEKHLDSDSSVLEIGCASGLTTQTLCTRVKSYIATDLSETMVTKLREKNLKNVEAHCMAADQIAQEFNGRRFDVIILNSVVHCFPGHSYLRKVIRDYEKLLTSRGIIFVGDVMDLKKRDELEQSLRVFKEAHPDKRTKTDVSSELFLPKEFFHTIGRGSFQSIICTTKHGKIENELTRYRYDVVMSKENLQTSETYEQEKGMFSAKNVKAVDEEEKILHEVAVDDDAYILYTSGTTGLPKGVRISQKSLLNYSTWAADAYRLDENSTIPLFSPLTFDFTVTCIVPPLLRGSKIEIFRPFSESFESIAKSTTLNVAKFSPIQLDTILSVADEPLAISTFVLGGEELTFNLLAKLKRNKQNQPFVVWNEYGPTEATVGCVVRRIASDEIEELKNRNIPIGNPIHNVSVAVTNSKFKPIGVGAKGCLAIGGSCLTSGFISSKPENKTAFKSACWDTQPGAVMYMTTDIVAYVPGHKELVYYGRNSTDITKINEMRVDVLEIQGALETVPIVESAWVSSFEFEGSTLLGAAVRLREEPSSDTDRWRKDIIQTLTSVIPNHCVPKVMVSVIEAPINKNGKKDVQLLQNLFTTKMMKSPEKTSGERSEIEEMLQEVWRSVLPGDQLPNIDDDFFFDLSGDSLQAIHLVRKLRNSGFVVSVSDIFQYPTIKALGSQLKEKRMAEKNKGKQYNCPFRPTPIAERYMLRRGKSDRFALSCLLQFKKSMDSDILQKAFQAVMVKHKGLSSRFFIQNGDVFQEYVKLEANKPSVFKVDFSKEKDLLFDEQKFQEICDKMESLLDIDKGELMNAAILEVSEGAKNATYVLIIVHHIVIDIVSWQQILEDLSTAFKQISSGENPSLIPACIPFDVFCELLWNEGANSSPEETDYWRTVDLQNTPSGFVETSNNPSYFKNANWIYKSVESRLVRKLASAVGSSEESVLLAALGRSLFRKIKENQSVSVCLESHGRHLKMLDSIDTVGWCTSMFPFILTRDEEKLFGTEAKEIMNNLCKMPSHGMKYCCMEKAGIKLDLPEIMFVFQGSLDVSIKTEFEAGEFSFNQLPCLEVVLRDLEQGKFHRHEDDVFDFPVQVISWFGDGVLRIGCLYDLDRISTEKVNTLIGDMIEILVKESKQIEALSTNVPLLPSESNEESKVLVKESKQTEALSTNIPLLPSESNEESKDKATKDGTRILSAIDPKSVSAQVVTNVTLIPECETYIANILKHEGFNLTELEIGKPEDFYSTLLHQTNAKQSQMVLVVVRNRDQKSLEQFATALKTYLDGRKQTFTCIVVSIEGIPLTVPLQRDLFTDVKTQSVTFYQSQYDAYTDEVFNIPLNVGGYETLSLALARMVIAGNKKSHCKAICVDGDYTLWRGECANDDILIPEAYSVFQQFLLQKKQEGFLLVLLSKNRQQDVEAAFSHNEMVLRQNDFVYMGVNWDKKSTNIKVASKALNLDLESFVFIDDSSVECEEMISNHPEVKTLRFPMDQSLITTFISSLWILDKMNITAEAANRTEMYKNEVMRNRHKEEQLTGDNTDQKASDQLFKLLKSWSMKLAICKSTLHVVKSRENLRRRTAELLYRTNQFKLNNIYTDIEELNDEDECWLVTLEDMYGSYGIVSVAVFGNNPEKRLKQWVLSCRALGRRVEHRIFHEILESFNCAQLQLDINDTGKNVPMKAFMTEVSSRTNKHSNTVSSNNYNMTKEEKTLHNISFVDDLQILSTPCVTSQENATQLRDLNVISSSNKISMTEWILTQWSDAHLKHVSDSHSLPKFLLGSNLPKDDSSTTKFKPENDATKLQQLWMEVLQTDVKPGDDDHFLRQGGNSFKAVFLLSRIQVDFGVKLDILDIMKTPSFASLKEKVDNQEKYSANTNTDSNAPLQLKRIPLSEAQKRMFVLQKTMPNSTAYTETVAIKTLLCRDAKYVFDQITKKHPILLAQIDPTGSYIYFPRGAIPSETTNFDSFSALQQNLSKAMPAFDICDGPLAQMKMFTCQEERVFIIYVHHIIVDDITLQNLRQSLKALVTEDDGEQSGKNSEITNTLLPFASFVESEKEYLWSSSLETDKAFWERTFEDGPDDLSLGLTVQSEINEFEIQSAKTTITSFTATTKKEIEEMCHLLGVTEFQYTLACFLLVLQRYMGREEILLAVPVSNRDSLNMNADGLFVNTVLFRYKVNLNMPFTEYVRDVANEWLAAFSHSRYPLNRVTQILWNNTGKSISNFCNVMFNHVRFSRQEGHIQVEPKHAKMQFSVDIVFNKDGGEIVCEHAAALIDQTTVDYFVASFMNVLAQARSSRHALLKRIEFMSQEEHALIETFSQTTEYSPRNTHVYNRFIENAKSGPSEIAIVSNENKVTYLELLSMIERISFQLEKSVDKSTLQTQPVLIYMDKDESAIASILAVWKVGGYFMPISKMHSSNLKQTVESTKPCAILINGSEKEVSQFEGETCVVLDIGPQKQGTMNPDITEFENNRQDLNRTAYIMRTSGSTGKPKEIIISQKNLSVIASAWIQVYEMQTKHISLLQWAPLSFDVFIGDIVRGLCCTLGTICLCPDEMRLDVDFIKTLIVENQITIAELTPQFGLHLTENAQKGELDSLEILILGSDTLQKEVYNKIKHRLAPRQRLINSYGMTEATIDSSCFEGNYVPNTRGGTIPIGRPLPGVKLQVLDATSLRRTPIGTVGELYIGGDVIGTGDTNIVEIASGDKYLKTNDRACWLPSGDLELLGRMDSMCKLRGFRIDTAELENTILKTCDFVKDACVTTMSNLEKGKECTFLCAFVTAKNNDRATQPSQRTIIEKIEEHHPYYMVPNFVQYVHEIPLTSNGKVDKKALPSIKDLLQKNDHHDQNELNPTAVNLRKLFAESLGVSESSVDVDRTFMEQGGHSLILMQFHSLIQKAGMLTFKITDLFSYPTIRSLAQLNSKLKCNENNTRSPANNEEFGNNATGQLDIAICGVGLRLPQNIRSLSQCWELFQEKRDLVTHFPENRKDDFLKCAPFSLLETRDEENTFDGCFLSNVDQFDNTLFKISATEAQNMAPEQRMMLEVATEVLAHAEDISEINGKKIGVFLSHADIGYSKLNHTDSATEISGLMPGMIATRIAYQYNLKGPTMLIDTACSSGLVALKLACESIRKKECSAALVGGANIIPYPSRTGVHGDKGILSPDFKCKPFDQAANGTSVGEGVICFFVEPLEKAMMKGRHIYGIIKSVAVNSVGKGNGITAPSSNSQAAVIQNALDQANMTASDISFLEAHGTGTILGDKIELAALSSVFESRSSSTKLPIGSAKSVFGHLDYAAGLAGLLKVLLGFMFKAIPPTFHFQTPHPELLDTPLCVPNKLCKWETESGVPRAAGVSSFGLTGTNCHAVLVESCSKNRSVCQRKQITPLFLCAPDFLHIKEQALLHEKLITHTVIKSNTNKIEDICYSVALKLKQLNKCGLGYCDSRIAVLAEDAKQLQALLRLISDCEDEESFQQMADARDDLFISAKNSPNQVKPAKLYTEGVASFIEDGTVDTNSLFPGLEYGEGYCAPGVAVVMTKAKRHWITPHNKENFRARGLVDMLYSKLSKTKELVRTLALAPTEELLKLEGHFCSAMIIELLKHTPLQDVMKTQQNITIEDAFAMTGMLGKYDKLFFIMIRELYNNGLVIPRGRKSQQLCLDTFSFKCKDSTISTAKAIANEAMVKYPQWADCFRFPLHCSRYLEQVLWGKMSPLSVIYPQGDLTFMHQFDKLGDLLGDVYYNMYMQLIVEYARTLSTRGQKVRILEVGAGMGHVTRQLLPSLFDVPNVEYWFTDLGKAFVENAKTVFAKYSSIMKFSTFDITKNAPKQGLLGSYDIVISYNVIHTTESVIQSVLNLKSCLGNDGTLFIIESAKNETWATLAWGILDGWWYFTDYDLRPYEPMLEPEKWESVLNNAGFGSVVSCPVDENERQHVEKFLFVCSAKQKSGKHISPPKSEWWNIIDVNVQRHEDFEHLSLDNDKRGLETETCVSNSAAKQELKNIWCELFDLEDIQDDEDFNALGGDSLLAIQMMTMVRKRIGFQLEIADTFCYTSLGSLGDYIADQLFSDEQVPSDQLPLDDQLTASASPSLCLKAGIERQSDTVSGEKYSSGCLLMFPGQGAQKIGMCLSMKDSEEAKSVFKAAEKIVGYNVLDLCLGSDEDLQSRLQSTEFVQVALLVGCLAKIAQLRKERPELLQSVTHVAGLSVGEFAALVYAEVLTFEDALMIVQKRGRAMEEELKNYSTAMASVLGPATNQLQKFLDENFPHSKISTYLADNQHTVAGTEEDIDQMIDDLSSNVGLPFPVIDVRRLRVSGAFHSSYMQRAENEVTPVIEGCTFNQPKLPVIMNVTGRICNDPKLIKVLLCEQIVKAVLWKDSVITACDCGVENFIEIAPSRVLSSIVRTRIDRCRGCKSELIVV